jgi:hypothetical protein
MKKIISRFLLLLIIISIAVIGYWTIENYDKIMNKISNPIAKIAEKIKTNIIKTEIRSYHTEIKSTQNFQVAEITQDEEFKREEISKWLTIPVGTAKTSIVFPEVKTTYYIDLREPYEMEYNEVNNRLFIKNLKLQFNRPAVDYSKMREDHENILFGTSKDEMIKKLKSEVTPELQKRAEKNINLILEIARKQTERFFREYILLTNKDAPDYEKFQKAIIEIRFINENNDGNKDKDILLDKKNGSFKFFVYIPVSHLNSHIS